jgi:hypothetical protein
MWRMNDERTPELDRFASIVTTSELTAAGISDAAIRTQLRRGELSRIGRGVYARPLPTGQSDRALRVAAALAIIGPDAVASHHDSALLHALAVLERPPPVIAVTRSPEASGSRSARNGVRLHLAALPRQHVTTVHGCPVTSVARTVVDLARSSPFKAGVVTADSALHARKVTRAELRAILSDQTRWPGVDRARRVIDFADARAESPFESVARVAFDDWGLPPPVLQVEVGEDYLIGRVDFLWPEHGVIAEADGAAKYADPRRAIRQLERDAQLRQAGFEVVHFTWYDLHANPHLVRQWILDAFRRQAVLRAANR